MIIIKCSNTQCSSTYGKFEWDESQYGKGIAYPNDVNAKKVVATCPTCSGENIVWVFKVKKAAVPSQMESYE